MVGASTLGARMGHGWSTKLKFRWHGWGKFWARSGHKTEILVAWLGQGLGTVGGQNLNSGGMVGASFGHGWGTGHGWGMVYVTLLLYNVK